MNWRHDEFVSSVESITEVSPLSEKREELVRRLLIEKVLNEEYSGFDLHIHISDALGATSDDITLIPDHFDLSNSTVAELDGGGYLITLEAVASDTILLDYEEARPPRPSDYVGCIVTYTLAAKLQGVTEVVDADVHVFPGDVEEYKEARALFTPDNVF